MGTPRAHLPALQRPELELRGRRVLLSIRLGSERRPQAAYPRAPHRRGGAPVWHAFAGGDAVNPRAALLVLAVFHFGCAETGQDRIRVALFVAGTDVSEPVVGSGDVLIT